MRRIGTGTGRGIGSAIAALTALAFALPLGGCGARGGSRDFVRAVGSSTVYPFASAVAEQVAKAGGRSPVIESTGTGAGMRLFCAGLGARHPDVEDASRRMTPAEYKTCVANGVTAVVEIEVGIDGIAFAEGRPGPGLKLTPTELYKALAARPFGQPNTTRRWSDVDPALPAIPILVYGPSSVSGTRDAFAELILTAGCKRDPATAALKTSAPDRFKAVCERVREDGAYVEMGENPNLTVRKIAQNPRAIGIFGFSYLDENADRLTGIPIDGVTPTYDTIASFEYPGARPLYIYVKKQHLAAVHGLRDYVMEWTRAWGPAGYLKPKGLIVAPAEVRARSLAIAEAMTPLDAAALRSN